jgi:hypothetical protein
MPLPRRPQRPTRGQRQPGQFFGFRPRTTTRSKLTPQASHTRTSTVGVVSEVSGFGVAFAGFAEPPGQPTAPGGLDQQHPTRVRHQRLAADDHGRPGPQVLMLHPRSASQLDPMWSRQPTSNRAEQALSRIRGPRVTHKINLV